MEPLQWILFGMLVIQLIILILIFSRQERKHEASVMKELIQKTEALTQQMHQMDRLLREENDRTRQTFARNEKEARQELTQALYQYEKTIGVHLEQLRNTSRVTARENREELAAVLKQLTHTTEQRLDQMRQVLEEKIRELQQDNQSKLEKMRETVDEKLHQTLEHRLGASFRQVSDRLEQVHQGLGEMQTLASGVGDLKKVLSNVKSRGVLGEVQLENLLENLLAPGQYAKNVATVPNSQERVEFAVKMPGRYENEGPVWLPIDAKFPTEDYQQLLAAYEKGEGSMIEESQRKLSQRIRNEARQIREKYVSPPHTTDFGILFLPFEGLYAEVLRLDLFEPLQREYKVMLAGPTTISAFLNSLQMGFRTLAIEKRSSEVWHLLAAVKTEFGKFGGILDKTRKKLDEASRVIESAGTRSRAIEKRLRQVEAISDEESQELLEQDFQHELEETL